MKKRVQPASTIADLTSRADAFARDVGRQIEERFAAELASDPRTTRSQLARAISRAILKRRPGRPRAPWLDRAEELLSQGRSPVWVAHQCVPGFERKSDRAKRDWIRRMQAAIRQRQRRRRARPSLGRT